MDESQKEIMSLISSAIINDEGDKLSIMLVNKHFTDKLKVNLEVKGFNPNKKGTIIELSSESPFDYNTRENRNRIKIAEKNITNMYSNMTLELPAHSIWVLKLTK